MVKKFSCLIIMFLCIFIAVSILVVMYGCASPMKQACKELTSVNEFLNRAYAIAIAAHMKDPNLVSEGNIEELIFVRNSISNLKGTACMLGDILPEK